jgi:hypothetical protein
MVVDTKNQILKQIKTRKYLNKDFGGFKQDLFEYAKVHFPDKIRDFSEASLGGLFLEMAAYVGDVQSFYLDHQFHELDPLTAVEPRNIDRHLRNSGVSVVGASPAVVMMTISLEVPADTTQSPPVPKLSALPVIQAGTTFPSNIGVSFELVDDVDFAEQLDGNYIASIKISSRDANNNPTAFIMSRKSIALSGNRQVESFSIGSFEAFKKFTLSKENVTEVISVQDSQGNVFYEVEYLTQDTIYKALINRNDDNELVKENMAIIPAPYRFTKKTELQSRLTTLTFGGGSSVTLDDDIVPDPSEFAVPLYGKRTFSRFSLNPGNLLQTTTLGAIVPNTTITIEYRFGGGLRHNITKGGLRGIATLNINFPNGATPSEAAFVRKSVDAINDADAAGGDDAPSIDELKTRIPAARASQSRIVTKEDLLARIYTMPSNFGRVYRASVRSNPNNPLATQLFIISRNQSGQLVVSPDSLKKNLQTYLNGFRMISDAIDILDAQVINLKLEFSVVVDPSKNKKLVLQNIVSRLKNYFAVKHFEIDQPIILSDLQNIIYNNNGIISVTNVSIKNLFGPQSGREYSPAQFDVQSNTTKGIIIGPPGSIFEIKFGNYDIEGTSV